MPLSQNTSQLVPPIRPNLAKETSQVSLSMSSLIDFENNLPSDDDNMESIEEIVQKVQGPKTEEDSRKEMLLEVNHDTDHVRTVAKLILPPRKRKLYEHAYNWPSLRSRRTKYPGRLHDYRYRRFDLHHQISPSHPPRVQHQQ